MAESNTLTQRDPKRVQAAFRIPAELVKRTRIAAAISGLSMQEIFRQGLELRLAKLEKQQVTR